MEKFRDFAANGHTLTLRRDDNRMGGFYGQHYYVEAINGVRGKVERLSHEDTGLNPYDRDDAMTWARAKAQAYGAKLIDQRPHLCLYGWSAD